jgi:uncharacterized protein (DUF1330 family)
MEMVAFVIAQIKVTDPDTFQEYMDRAPATISQYGGRHIARGARTVTLQGEENTTRNGLIQFPSMEDAIAWFNSPEYQEIKKIRDRSSESHFMVWDGVD